MAKNRTLERPARRERALDWDGDKYQGGTERLTGGLIGNSFGVIKLCSACPVMVGEMCCLQFVLAVV